MTATRNRRMKGPFGSLERAQLVWVGTRYDVRITTDPLQDPALNALGFFSMNTGARLAGVLLCALAACSHDQPPAIPADRPVLLWYGGAAQDQNRRNLPPGFAAPDEHACAADTTRIYLGELFLQGNVQVKWHWSPIVRGPDADKPTLDQPEFSLAGTLVDASDSTDDVLADHPFGLDVVADVTPDAPFAFLPFNGPVFSQRALHPEVETRTFPRTALGWVPQGNDRTLMRGAWVLDCGHPPYGAELHPPTFLGYARPADATTTVSAAIVMPYRSSLLFHPDPALATDFANTARFSDASSLPFSFALQGALLAAAQNSSIQRLATHALMTANRFDTLDWAVCAPLPRPAGANLAASWRFTTRTGVTMTATPIEADGCVRFLATMTAAYTPMPLTHADADWPWADVSTSASNQLGQTIDVRLALINTLQQNGFVNADQAPALQPDHPPLVDTYAPLLPRAGADADSPTAIDTGADDQPFPFYGRARVGWK
jgi:hypothetical protein